MVQNPGINPGRKGMRREHGRSGRSWRLAVKEGVGGGGVVQWTSTEFEPVTSRCRYDALTN